MSERRPYNDAFDLVKCHGCRGNVWIKVPKGGEPPMNQPPRPPVDLPPPPPPGQPRRDGRIVRAPTQQRVGSRITLVEQMTFQRQGEPARSHSSRFEMVTKTNVEGLPVTTQPFEVGGEWMTPVVAWPASVAQVIIENMEGRYVVRPTPAEEEATALRVLEIGFGPDPRGDEVVRPLATHRGEMPNPSRLRLRSRSGTIKVVITAVPG